MKALLIIFLSLCMPFALIFVAGLTLWGLIKLFWLPALIVVGIRLAFAVMDAVTTSRRS